MEVSEIKVNMYKRTMLVKIADHDDRVGFFRSWANQTIFLSLHV